MISVSSGAPHASFHWRGMSALWVGERGLATATPDARALFPHTLATAVIPAMTNHNNIWYESGQAAARYGSEPGTGESDADSRIRSIIQIIQILHGSTMPHLQLFCEEDCGSVCLRSQ